MLATIGSILNRPNSRKAAYIATTANSPCAKLTTRTTPKITDRPSAISPYTRPVSTPWIRTSA